MPSPHHHYMSPAYKAHLERQKKLESQYHHSSLGAKDFSLKHGSNVNSLPIDSAFSPLNTTPHRRIHRTFKDENLEKDNSFYKFKDFDFISKQKARYLLEILKQPVFMNMLPREAQNIIKLKITSLLKMRIVAN